MGGTDAPILATNGMCSISYNSYNSDWEVDTYERDFLSINVPCEGAKIMLQLSNYTLPLILLSD